MGENVSHREAYYYYDRRAICAKFRVNRTLIVTKALVLRELTYYLTITDNLVVIFSSAAGEPFLDDAALYDLFAL